VTERIGSIRLQYGQRHRRGSIEAACTPVRHRNLPFPATAAGLPVFLHSFPRIPLKNQHPRESHLRQLVATSCLLKFCFKLSHGTEFVSGLYVPTIVGSLAYAYHPEQVALQVVLQRRLATGIRGLATIVHLAGMELFDQPS
jgi:hypothetical protein